MKQSIHEQMALADKVLAFQKDDYRYILLIFKHNTMLIKDVKIDNRFLRAEEHFNTINTTIIDMIKLLIDIKCHALKTEVNLKLIKKFLINILIY